MSADIQQSNNGNNIPVSAFNNSLNIREKFTQEQIAWALRRNKGLILPTAKTLQCSTRTIYNLIEKYPELNRVKTEARSYITDFTEVKLLEAIKLRQSWAVSLWLKTQAGYSEKNTVEHTGANGGPIQVEDVSENKRMILAGMIKVQLEAGYAISEALKYVVSMGVPKEHLRLLQKEDLVLTSNGNGAYGLPGDSVGNGNHG